MRCVVVSGTSTGVGKTVVTSALVRVALDEGLRTAMVKPVQTGGSTDELTDVQVVRALSGCTHATELVSLVDPLAPDSAARLRGVSTPSVADLAAAVVGLGSDHDLIVVEGAGGLLVRLDTSGGTLLQLADALAQRGSGVELVVVTTLSLGTLNHTELTVRAAVAAGHEVKGLIVGSIPAEWDLASRCNIGDLPRVTGVPVLGGIPAGAGQWPPDRFRAACRRWLPPGAWLTQR